MISKKEDLARLVVLVLALQPIRTYGSAVNSALVMDVGVMEECPPANPDTSCPPAIVQSDLWRVAHLEPCAASNGPNLFAEDPFCGAVLHACSDRSTSSSSASAQGGRRAALPNTCGDFRFKDVAVDERQGQIFVASTWAIYKAALPSNLLDQTSTASSITSTADPLTNFPLVVGFSVVHLKGFNLGASQDEVVGISLRGVPCRSILYFNDTNLACVVGDLAVLSAPLTGACVEVRTLYGGPFTGVLPEELARTRLAAGAQKPLVYGLHVDDRGFSPNAICVYEGDISYPTTATSTSTTATTTTLGTTSTNGRVFWANRAAGTVESSRLDGSHLIRHAKGLPRVAGLVTSSDGATLFVSDAENGRILALFVADAFTSSSSVSLSDRADGIVDFSSVKASLEQSANWREIVPPNSGLIEPWGLAYDEFNGYLFVSDASAGKVWRVEQVQPPFRAITSHPATAPATATATTTATATATAAAAAAVDDTASTSTGELKANATQANLLASSTMTGEEVAATAAAPIMAVVAVNAHVRLSGVAVMPPLSNDVKVPGRLDLSRRLVWTDTNAHAVLKASLHGSHEAPFTSTPLHPNGNAISTSSPSSYSTTTSTAYAATQAARSAWNTANAPAMNQAQSYVEQQQQAAGGSRQQYQGALLWPVAVRGVGGARQHSSSSSGSSGSNIDEERSSSDGDGASATPSVLPNGVVVAEYLGRVWLLRDDGGATEPQLLVDTSRASYAGSGEAKSSAPSNALRAFLAATSRDSLSTAGGDITRPNAYLQLTA